MADGKTESLSPFFFDPRTGRLENSSNPVLILACVLGVNARSPESHLRVLAQMADICEQMKPESIAVDFHYPIWKDRGTGAPSSSAAVLTQELLA